MGLVEERRLRFLWLVVGGSLAAGAVAALVGWRAGLPPLAAPLAGLPPVQPEVALGIALCGLGLVLSAWGRSLRRAAAGLGLVAAAIGLVGVVRLAFGVDPGLSDLLAGAPVEGGPLPEPIAPNAAIALLLAGGALLAGRRAPTTRCVLGACCAALGASAVLGYATGVDSAYGWDATTRMAPTAAAGLAILGLALGLAREPFAEPDALRSWRAPLFVGLSSAVATILFCQALSLHQERQLELAVDAGASRLRAEVGARLGERMRALELLARVWKGRFFPSREAWESDAELIMSQSPGLEAIEWLESGGAAGWVYPSDVALPSPDARSLDAHREAGHAILAGPLRLPGGRPGVRILVPLRADDTDTDWLSSILGTRDGWLAGVFDTQALLSDLVAPLSGSYVIRVASGDVIFYQSENARWDLESRFARDLVLAFPGGMRMTAWVQPSPDLADARRSALVPLSLAGGLSMSALLAIALGLANVARARAARLEREIAERARAEAEVRRLNEDLEERVELRTRELTRSNEDLQRFAAFLSHELRQPIATQGVWVELLHAEGARLLDDACRRYLDEIRSFTGRISESIEAQLALFSVSGAPLNCERVDVVALIAGLVAEMKDQLESRRAQVRVGELPVLFADARLLHQLFRNLFENALHCARDGVSLALEVRPGASMPDAPSLAEIVVEDNGCGFSAADAERIFEPGGRVDPERTGTGLGLTVCRRIAERHGGRLVAEGRPGSGALFRIALPRARADARAGEETSGAPVSTVAEDV